MTVEKTDERRWTELVFEVPGTPEQVWHAIATGPGISSWLFPTEVEEREGGAVAFHIGPGLESTGTVTSWQPPRRFAYEEPDWMPGAPPLATEFVVEARAGGTCVVRLVHSLFASQDDWDDQFDGFEQGWRSFFEVLRQYLQHFSGLPCAPWRAMRSATGTEGEAWAALSGAFGLGGVREGERVRSDDPGAPRLAGTVTRVGHGAHHFEVMLRLDEPAPGLALLGAYTWSGKAHAAASFYLFGDGAAAAKAREEPLWQAYLERLFPAS